MSQTNQPMLFESLPGERVNDHDTTLTPLSLLNRLGTFDLDPCAFPGHATAKELICWPQDGLQMDWTGRVWLNPPYSEPSPWLERLATHGDGIALVLASTDTNWFHDYVTKSSGLLFIRGRPLFLREDFTEVGLMRASVFVAFGASNAHILRNSGINGWFVPVGAAGLPNILAIPADWPADYQAQFWALYPRKTDKKAAIKSLDKVAFEGKTRWADLINGIERYKLSNDVKRGYAKHPATFLNKGSWMDEEQKTPTQVERKGAVSFFDGLEI